MFGPPSLPRTLEAALRDLKSAKAKVRAEAARELAPHADEARAQVLKALEGALRDADSKVRAAAALALADIQGREALASLLFAIEDDDAYVRQMAILALGEIGDSRASERISRALGDKRPEVRFQAVMAFPRVCRDHESALSALLSATRDSDEKVCHIALRMLEELGAREAQDEHHQGLDEQAIARAGELLGHASPSVQLAAAILLARADISQDAEPSAKAFEHGAFEDVLLRAAQGALKTEDGEDEAAAVELCGELKLRKAIPALERRAFGVALGLGRDRFAWNARVALAQMEHPRAIREIIGELNGWNRDRRTLAAAAVGRARIQSARPLLEAMRNDSGKADEKAVEAALSALEEGEDNVR